MSEDPILIADRAELDSAVEAIRSTTTKDELVSVWWRDCDHFSGRQRERLQAEYADRLAQLTGAMVG